MILAMMAAALLAPLDLAPSEAVRAAVVRLRSDPAALAKALEELADVGDASAAQALGEVLSAGVNGRPDHRRACDAFERAAGKRADSRHNLATCFFRGEGRPQDLERARSLYDQASRQGVTRSDCALGNMLLAGQGGPADPKRGLALCRKGAEAGDPDAQADLAGHLLAPRTGAKDAIAARAWLERAAGQGHANAALLLGKVHWNGDGTPKNNAEAARWWRAAHDTGNKQAAFLLGQEAFVRLGRSGATPAEADPAALEDALRWLELAARDDPDPQARAQADALAGQLRQLRGHIGRR
jgi:TPR repeat protein